MAFVGIAMAVGVGVAVGSKSDARAVEATTQTSSLIFTAACGGSGTADDSKTWTVTSDGAESTYDATSGIHYGTSSKSVGYLQLASESFDNSSWRITSVLVNARDAQGTGALTVKVGATSYKYSSNNSVTLTNTSTDYSFTSTSETYGDIVVKIDRGSKQTKAIYVKKIIVSYDDGETSGSITVNPSSLEVANGKSSTVNVAYENLTSNISISKTSGAGAVSVSPSSITVSSTAAANQDITITGTTNGALVLTLTSGETTTTLNVTVCATTTYTKVLDIDKLYNGQNILITNSSGTVSLGAQKVDGSDKMTNRDAVENTIVNGNDIYLKNDSLATRITVGIREETDGTIHYSFFDNTVAATGYLKGGHADKKLVTTQDVSEGGALWTIVIDGEGAAEVVSNGDNAAKIMRFNNGAPNLFNCYSGGQQDIAIFARYDNVTNAQVVTSFVARYMKMESVSTSNTGTTANCDANWTAASTAYAKLTADQKALFVGGDYANASARFGKWAKAHGQTLNETTGALSALNVSFISNTTKIESFTPTLVIIIISTVSLVAVAGYFVIRRRKENN